MLFIGWRSRKDHACFGRQASRCFFKLKLLSPRAGSGVDRIDPVHLLAGYRKRRLNQALSPLLALVFVCVLLCCLLGPLFVYRLRFCVFCLLVVTVKLSVLAKWLSRLLWGSYNRGVGIVSTTPRPKCVYDFRISVLFHCLIVYFSCPQAPALIFHTPMARYSLFVLKVPLNTN